MENARRNQGTGSSANRAMPDSAAARALVERFANAGMEAATLGMEALNIPKREMTLQVDFHAMDNARSHNTDQFEVVHETPATPVFRRGQTFTMDVTFPDKPINFSQDSLKFIFSFGPQSTVMKGTKIILPVSGRSIFGDQKNVWDSRVRGNNAKKLTLEFQVPPSAHVGIWKCEIRRSLKSNSDLLEGFTCKEDIYILFNPFCKDDLVYLEDPVLRQEYVMNDHGKVWVGTHRKIKGRHWAFGQFDPLVLPTCAYLLGLSKLAYNERGNPVKVSRAISAVVNSNDDRGLLTGNWSGYYSDGVAPRAWTGTVPIIEKYVQSGMSPVNYGQCWVFSAATVTVCRALGIPCRSVTNFVSAHDSNNSCTIDKFFDEDGDEMYDIDSLWNFHVWNDVWMARPDLPKGYGGWQAIDATPQEFSDNIFQCGPASVLAIRNGEIGYQYDTPFVFAEVNADVCHYKQDSKSDWGFTLTEVKEYAVGKIVATKNPYKNDDEGDTDMEDVTSTYKNEEGTISERMSVFNAIRGCEKAQQYYNCAKECDVTFCLECDHKVAFGQPFKATVTMENKSNQPRTIAAVLNASSVYYTGVTAHPLKKGQSNIVLPPNKREILQINVSPNEYMDKLVDYSMIKVYAMASVQETIQSWSEEDDFDLEKPNLKIEITGKPKATVPCQVKFSFTNPLKINLTECTFSIEGPGLTKAKIMPFRNVKPGELVVHTESLVPRRTGQRKILAIFNSHEMHHVVGSKTMTISE